MWNVQLMNERDYGPRGALMRSDSIVSHLAAAETTTIPGTPAIAIGTVFSGADFLARAAARLVRNFRISRVLTGLFLILHGIAHARAGTVLSDPVRSWRLFDGTMVGTIMLWITGTLWATATVGFVAGGLGLLGVTGLRRYGRRLVFIAAIASVLLLALAGKPYALAGAVIDVALFVLVGFTEVRTLRGRWMWHRTLIEEAALPVRPATRVRRAVRTSGNVIGWAFLVYVAVLVALRPWHLTWGATEADLGMTLPADDRAPRVAATHAVTIDAPASAVRPWLAKAGQERASAYTLQSVDSVTTRLVIRTRAGDGGFLSAPLDLLLLEPGHFLRERRMMLGIKERSEAMVRTRAER